MLPKKRKVFRLRSPYIRVRRFFDAASGLAQNDTVNIKEKPKRKDDNAFLNYRKTECAAIAHSVK